MKVLKKGDVVFGAFYTANDARLRHHSVVLDVFEQSGVAFARLVYTTSLGEGKGADPRHQFTHEDRMLADWDKPCRWDAGVISLTPISELTYRGRISNQTLNAIRAEYTLHRTRKSVTEVVGMASERHNLVLARAR